MAAGRAVMTMYAQSEIDHEFISVSFDRVDRVDQMFPARYFQVLVHIADRWCVITVILMAFSGCLCPVALSWLLADRYFITIVRLGSDLFIRLGRTAPFLR